MYGAASLESDSLEGDVDVLGAESQRDSICHGSGLPGGIDSPVGEGCSPGILPSRMTTRRAILLMRHGGAQQKKGADL